MSYDLKIIKTINQIQRQITNIEQINDFLRDIQGVNEEHKILIAIILFSGITNKN